MGSLFVLQSGIAFFAGANLDDILDVVDKDLAVADVSGVQGLLGGRDSVCHGNLADDRFHLDLGKQIQVHRNAAIVFRAALLDAAAENLRDRDARDSDPVEFGLEGFDGSCAGAGAV